MSMSELKKAATIVGCLTTIVTGIDKIKTVVQKWRDEYNVYKNLKDVEFMGPPPDSTS